MRDFAFCNQQLSSDGAGPSAATVMTKLMSGLYLGLTLPTRCSQVPSKTLLNDKTGEGWSPGLHKAITWTNADSLSFEPSGINFDEISLKEWNFYFKKVHLKILSSQYLNMFQVKKKKVAG